MPESGRSGMRSIDATIAVDGAERTIEGHGNGPVAAYIDALTRNCGVTIKVRDYHQHAIGHGADASSVTYIEAEREDGTVVRSEEHKPELQSLMRISYAVFRLKTKKHNTKH